jgi:hypothetical protein
MRIQSLTVATPGLLGVMLAFADDGSIQLDNARISLFSVPFECPAAPGLGCGSLSKPVLLELEQQPGIAEAWLNETGTLLAVVGAPGSVPQFRAKAVESVLEQNGANGKELDGENRDAELKDFAARTGWYRGASVDDLSKREAAIIASRLVRRVRTKVAVPEEKAEAVTMALTQVIEKRLIYGGKDSNDQYYQEGVKIVRTNLGEEGLAAFEAAIAKGYRPRPEDEEPTKVTRPNCCSIQAR